MCNSERLRNRCQRPRLIFSTGPSRLSNRRKACTLKLIDQAKEEWKTVGPAAQILIDVISHHVNRGSSPAKAAETVRAALNGSINTIAEDHLTDQRMSRATVFGGTGFVGRRVVRHLRESGIRVRIVSRHRRPGDDAGIEQIAADAHDERSVEAAIAGADGVVNAISLYVEHGTDTFHSVHVETAAKIARAARQAGISINTARWYVKQIYAKTGVKRQAELDRMLLKTTARI